MQQQATGTLPRFVLTTMRHSGTRAVGIVALVLLFSFLWPFVPIFVGMLLIIAVGTYAMPELKPYVHSLLRVPIASPSKRRAHLLLVAGAGALLVVSGSVAATIGARARSKHEQQQQRNELVERQARELLGQARGDLAAGNVGRAELVLMDADALEGVDAEKRDEIDELLGRVRRSGDSEAILDVLVRLPQKELEAFAAGTSVPPALDLGERALTLRAVEIARGQLEEARRMRAGR